ncbi:UNVERIFIED_CONTAM: hypothetical protein Sradi_6130600, partial [Sesamum radiatum]
MMEGCPWTFEKHLLILSQVEADDNPQAVELNWCSFYVHIHGLSLRQRTEVMAHLIGSRIGRVIEVPPSSHRLWGSDMRIRVALEVRKPLLRCLQLSSASGEKLTVSFSYERLPFFYCICGLMGHIARQCEKQYEEGYIDTGKDKQYGPWLCTAVGRGLPRRIFGDIRSPGNSGVDTIANMMLLKCGVETRRGVRIFEPMNSTTVAVNSTLHVSNGKETWSNDMNYLESMRQKGQSCYFNSLENDSNLGPIQMGTFDQPSAQTQLT